MSHFLKPYVCLVCGGTERLSYWDLERKTKPRCPHCGSLALVRANNVTPKTKKKPPPKPRRVRSPEEKTKGRIAWLKRHHEDFAARRKHGWKPKATS